MQDFPYACQPGIEHHNIWCTQPLSEDEIWAVIEKHRPEVEGWENLMFVNPVELQSVKAVSLSSSTDFASVHARGKRC